MINHNNNAEPDRVNEINDRFSARQFGTNSMEPVFDPRPVGTKGGMMPVIATHIKPTEAHKHYNMYDTETMFIPATKPYPFNSYKQKVDTESELRNQFIALQRSDKCVYVPGSGSDLYVPPNTQDMYTGPNMYMNPNAHELLFEDNQYASFNPDPLNRDTKPFNNKQ